MSIFLLRGSHVCSQCRLSASFNVLEGFRSRSVYWAARAQRNGIRPNDRTGLYHYVHVLLNSFTSSSKIIGYFRLSQQFPYLFNRHCHARHLHVSYCRSMSHIFSIVSASYDGEGIHKRWSVMLMIARLKKTVYISMQACWQHDCSKLTVFAPR